MKTELFTREIVSKLGIRVVFKAYFSTFDHDDDQFVVVKVYPEDTKGITCVYKSFDDDTQLLKDTDSNYYCIHTIGGNTVLHGYSYEDAVFLAEMIIDEFCNWCTFCLRGTSVASGCYSSFDFQRDRIATLYSLNNRVSIDEGYKYCWNSINATNSVRQRELEEVFSILPKEGEKCGSSRGSNKSTLSRAYRKVWC